MALPLTEEHAAIGRAVRDYYRKRCMAEVASAIRNNELPRPYTKRCVDCGAQADVYEHRNYARPLDIAPVCNGCNIRRGPAELDTDVIIHHLRHSDDMPFENARLRRLGSSRFQRPCACCKDGKHYHRSHDVEIVEKPNWMSCRADW